VAQPDESHANRTASPGGMTEIWASKAGSWGGGACPPWIFIHGTDIVDRDLALKWYFSVFF